MAFHKDTRAFMSYLQNNRPVRDRIRAKPDRTLLYAGHFFEPMWQEIERLKKTSPEINALQTLPDVLATIPSPDPSLPSLKAHVEALTRAVPWMPDGFITWRALSGIFASNASGRVYFCVGSDISKVNKVLAATEVTVLLRNANIDATTRNIVEWLNVCVQTGKTDINFGFLPS